MIGFIVDSVGRAAAYIVHNTPTSLSLTLFIIYLGILLFAEWYLYSVLGLHRLPRFTRDGGRR